MPVRTRADRRRRLNSIERTWLLGLPSFYGLLGPNLPTDADKRALWAANRAWALAEAERQGLPAPWQVEAFG